MDEDDLDVGVGELVGGECIEPLTAQDNADEVRCQLLAAHHFERVHRKSCHWSSKTLGATALLADLIEGTSATEEVAGDLAQHAVDGVNLPESQFPAPTLADHQTRELQHRKRTQHLRRWQTGRDGDLVGGARAAGRKRVVDT